MPKTPEQPTKGAEHYTVKRKYNLYFVSLQVIKIGPWITHKGKNKK